MNSKINGFKHTILQSCPLNRLYPETPKTSEITSEVLEKLEALCSNADGYKENISNLGLKDLEDIGIRADELFARSLLQLTYTTIMLDGLLLCISGFGFSISITIALAIILFLALVIIEYYNAINYKNYILFRNIECGMEMDLLNHDIITKKIDFPDLSEFEKFNDIEKALNNHEMDIKSKSPDIYFKISALINNMKDIRTTHHTFIFHIINLFVELLLFILNLFIIPDAETISAMERTLMDRMMGINLNNDIDPVSNSSFTIFLLMSVLFIFVFGSHLRNIYSYKQNDYIAKAVENRWRAAIKEGKI